jgi:uncharacterized protein (DUF488 family)
MIWTVGHSNQPAASLLEMLTSAGIELLVDVRRYPISRRNPQFNHDTLAATLALNRIDYVHTPELGGRREPNADSSNTALREAGFRGFADYMATSEFASALATLIENAEQRRTAIMCAESLPWRCHRSLISDSLVARGLVVEHLLRGKTRKHILTPSARVEGGHVSYPALL